MSTKLTINHPLNCVPIGLGSRVEIVNSLGGLSVVSRQSDNGVMASRRSAIAATILLAAYIASGSANAADCPGHPGALGVSRTLAVDPSEHPLLGGVQYRESLPLNDKEVVLTFDDGPL